MKKWFLAFLISFIFIGNVWAFEQQIAQKSTVILAMTSNDISGVCNGVVIKHDDNYSTVLTAKHCVNNFSEIYVEDHIAYIIKKSEIYDLVYLFVPGHLNKEAVNIAYINAKFNQKLYYIGEVLGIETNLIGRVIFPFGQTASTLHIIKGNSGGAVFDEFNQLIGIIVSGQFGKNVDYAIISFAETANTINYFLKFEVKDWNL